MCGKGFGRLLFPFVAASVLVKGSADPAPMNASRATCPKCKTQILSSYEWCPQCGTGLKAQVCSYCGTQNESNMCSCSSCGAPTGVSGKL